MDPITTTQVRTCLCGNPAATGRYCRNCLESELEWNTVSREDLEAAASRYDRLREEKR